VNAVADEGHPTTFAVPALEPQQLFLGAKEALVNLKLMTPEQIQAASKAGDYHATLELAEQVMNKVIETRNPTVTASRLYFLAARQSGLSSGIVGLSTLAKEGNAVAELHMADLMRYFQKANPKEAQTSYLKAANKGMPEAMYEVALGMEGDPKNAKKWFNKASNEGFGHKEYAKRMQEMGFAQEQPKKVPAISVVEDKRSPNVQKTVYTAKEIASIEAKANDDKLILDDRVQSEIFPLAHAYQSGTFVPLDLAKANFLFKRLALAGNTKAIMELAHNFEVGTGVKQHFGTAANLYYIAAMYETPTKVAINSNMPNMNMAVLSLKALEELTHSNVARLRLGDYYRFNKIRDLQKSVKYYRLAAAEDIPEAIYQFLTVSRELGTTMGLKMWEDKHHLYGYKPEQDALKRMQFGEQNLIKTWLPQLLEQN
jgi:TPR repeat protein